LAGGFNKKIKKGYAILTVKVAETLKHGKNAMMLKDIETRGASEQRSKRFSCRLPCLFLLFHYQNDPEDGIDDCSAPNPIHGSHVTMQRTNVE
jgi:hypothetical protein